MITEDYVSLETAKLLKEKGFNEKCNTCYTAQIASIYTTFDRGVDKNDIIESYTLRPTLQMTVKWLLEVHNLSVDTVLESGGFILYISNGLKDPSITGNIIIQQGYFNIREKAIEEGIKYCLTNLIG